MSKTTKKKHVTKEVMEEYCLPEGDQEVVKVLGSPGNNLHEVQTAKGERYLASMPTKFRKTVWIKRGDFILVTPIAEGDRVKAEIEHILYKQQIKYIKDEGKWPAAFSDPSKKCSDAMIPDDLLPPSDGDSADDEDHPSSKLDRVNNPNRPPVEYCDSGNDSESEGESDDETEKQSDIT